MPRDYQIVYKEIQRYFLKVGPVDLVDGPLLPELVDFFEEVAAAGKGVLQLIGSDVAAFCDDLTAAFDVTGPTISHPPEVFREAGLVDRGSSADAAAPGSATGLRKYWAMKDKLARLSGVIG